MQSGLCRWGILGTATIARKNWKAMLNAENAATLNAVVTNENLTLEEAVRVLQYPADETLSLLELLTAQGYLENHSGRYCVATDWDRAVVRFLRRKHLLHS